MVETIFGDGAVPMRLKVVGIYGVLLAAHLLAWFWALIASRDHPLLLGTAFLAHSFGLRQSTLSRAS